MSETCEFIAPVCCPHCGTEQDVRVGVSMASGTAPRESQSCVDCGGAFVAQATVAVSVTAATSAAV
jgi:hypothetical protein